MALYDTISVRVVLVAQSIHRGSRIARHRRKSNAEASRCMIWQHRKHTESYCLIIIPEDIYRCYILDDDRICEIPMNQELRLVNAL